MSLVLGLYRTGMTVGLPLIDRILRRRIGRDREDPARIDERRGVAGLARPSGPLMWLHAASVGESMSAQTLIARLLEADRTAHVLVTTGTVTSARMMVERLPPRAFHQFVPVDRPAWVKRFLDHWRPDLACWLESELWPNLVLETHLRGVPMCLLNARMSAKSHANWSRQRAAARKLLGAFDLCLAQDDAAAALFRDLGAREVRSAGNLKLGAAPLPVDEAALAEMRASVGDRPVWLAASTHEGEEAIAAEVAERLRARWPDLLTIVAPRHPARGAEIAAMLRARGLEVARRGADEALTPSTAVYLADTMGEMGLWYRLAPIAFVGASLVPKNGHNPFEAAQLACAILFGPHMTGSPDSARLLLEGGAAQQVSDAGALTTEVEALLADPDACRARAEAGLAVVAAHRDVIDRTLAAIRPYLDRRDPA